MLLSQVPSVFLKVPTAAAPLTLGVHGTQEGTQLVLLHAHQEVVCNGSHHYIFILPSNL